jgi:hypothetical protein
MSILQDSIPNIQVLDLTGCPLDSILYYVNQDIPVLALFDDGNAVLIIGFNEQTPKILVIMDPQTGEVIRMNRDDAVVLFEENGNRFITYIRTRT